MTNQKCRHKNGSWFSRSIETCPGGGEGMHSYCNSCGACVDHPVNTQPDKNERPKEKMKPCPFCGGREPQFMSAPDSWYRCRKCGAESPMKTCPSGIWQNAYCWKLLDEEKKKVQAYREVAKKYIPISTAVMAFESVDKQAERILRGEKP